MIPGQNSPFRRRESRRCFIKKAGAISATVAVADLLQFPLSAATPKPEVSIVLDPADDLVRQAPVQWASGQLRAALMARGFNAVIVAGLDQAPPENECIFVTRASSPMIQQASAEKEIVPPDSPESLVLTRRQLDGGCRLLLAAGSDARGLVYALLELADRVNCADDPLDQLRTIKTVVERPANRIRSVSRLFVSDVEDKSWFNNREFWQRYLTMLATNRFNRFNLGLGLGYDFTSDITDCYFHFAYPFLLNVPGHNVRAVPLPDAERDANLEMLRFISDEAARRGLQFQLGIWTHAYRWSNSPHANYTIEGLTPETQGPYCSDALRLLLTECPNITGVTIRTHGESGVAEGDTEIWKTIFDGAAGCGRKVEIDLHAKGINQSIINAALATGMPVNISPKFWAEHMGLPYMQGAIRAQEMPPRDGHDRGFFSRSSGSRSFLRYGFGDLFDEQRRYGVLHRIWPGTQRVLLWGDPETAAAYGRVSSFCGGNGVEILEPLTFKGRKGSGQPGGRNAYADETLRPEFDFEKYDYTYRVWGRNLYNPDTDADGWRRLLRKQFAHRAGPAETALSSAGKILPLFTTAHCPSAANNNYWPEMYWDMQMADASHKHPYGDTPNPKRFGTASPLDPEFFLTCDEFARELVTGESSGKFSPSWVAARLDDYAERTFAALRKFKADASQSVDVRRMKIDATIQAGLGKFFAAKLRAGVFYSLYLQSNNTEALRDALQGYRVAREAWTELSNVAKGVYVTDVTYGPDYYQRGHWQDRLAAIDEDIADIEKLSMKPTLGSASKLDWKAIRSAIGEAGVSKLDWKFSEHTHPLVRQIHVPPESFRPGIALSLTMQPPASYKVGTIAAVQLRYRHVNQAETWQEIGLEHGLDGFHGAIPAAYTASPFPLQYYFRICLASGKAVLCPGLETRFNGQPYFVVRQAR